MSYRLLLADNQMIIRSILRQCAEANEAFTVCPHEAENGQEAIDLALEHKPDAVILDNEMPGMTGLEALPVIRGALPDRVIVMYSSATFSSTGEAAVNAGADAYFHKGSQPPEDVVACVAQRLAT